MWNTCNVGAAATGPATFSHYANVHLCPYTLGLGCGAQEGWRSILYEFPVLVLAVLLGHFYQAVELLFDQVWVGASLFLGVVSE